jgi:hypothetical protein
MHARVDLVLSGDSLYELLIADGALVKRYVFSDGFAMSVDKIVQNDNLFAAFPEVFNSDTSDISCAAGN